MTNLMLFLFGLCWGSFINVCIYRIPDHQSIIFPRSHCPNCKTTLRIIDLIPLISYIFLHGHCHHCHQKIFIEYPIIEIIFGISSLWYFTTFPIHIEFLFIWLVYSLLWIVSIIDIHTQYIYNNCLILLLLCGLFLTFIHPTTLSNLMINLFTLILPLTCISLYGNKIGIGDIYFIAIFALILNINELFLSLFIASCIASITSIIQILCKIKTRKDSIPFIPFLSLGFIFAILFGSNILSFYTNFLFNMLV